jgi:acetyl-CoA acetyltransferase
LRSARRKAISRTTSWNRGITELIYTLVRRGGGVGLFTGCAAGDTGAAVVLRVDD